MAADALAPRCLWPWNWPESSGIVRSEHRYLTHLPLNKIIKNTEKHSKVRCVNTDMEYNAIHKKASYIHNIFSVICHLTFSIDFCRPCVSQNRCFIEQLCNNFSWFIYPELSFLAAIHRHHVEMRFLWLIFWFRGPSWTSWQIRKIAGCACAGNCGNVFPATAG